MVSPAQPARSGSPWPRGSLLARLSQPSRDRLLKLGTLRRYRAGDVLFRQGAQDTHVALLIDAVTKATYTGRDGREALLAIRVSGDTVGEMAALNDHPRTATVTACGKAVIRVVSQQQFRGFLGADPHAALEFARMVSNRLRSANRKRIDFTVYPTQVRVARVLIELARTYGDPTASEIRLGFSITQCEIAGLVSAAEVTVQKALRELRTRGLIETNYRGFVVWDLAGLRIAARLEPDRPPV